ncbi:hypothetical protein [Streptomyces sp. NPDC059909]|uniref:hypothetical protein n=1 Tax=Streptomyces sp. NPDC059909 TaxID=3346998 RepID=UPI003646C1DD
MTSTSSRSPRGLLAATALLALTGMILLSLPHGTNTPAAPLTPEAAAPANGHPTASPTDRTTPTTDGSPSDEPATAGPTGTGPASALPPHGEGYAGDRAIHQALEEAWPADLAADDERQLLAAGRALLRADATGIQRGQWPTVFPTDGRAVAPAFTRFRIQAAIARQDGGPNQAVVHLVWAGADRGGTYTDGRISDLSFTRTPNKKGPSAWTPQQRRT